MIGRAMAVSTFMMVFKWRKMLSDKILTLGFEREDGQTFNFLPGQFITMLFDTDEGLKRRSYSVATIPNHKHHIEIVLTLLEGGVASDRLAALKPGESVKALGPVGRLILQEDTAKRYIFVGTSTGIAPYRSMLPELSERIRKNDDFSAVVIEGVQYRRDLLYQDDFLAFASEHKPFRFQAMFSQDALEDAKPYESCGHVQDAFDSLNLNPEEDIVYLCGNPNMIDDAFALLTNLGFEVKSVRREKYISSN